MVAPTSPEAFYQEVGRAGRDRKSSEAELLFCDIQHAVTNRILDPSLSHKEVMAAYREITKEDPYGGGDRKSVVKGKSVSGRVGLGGRRNMTKKKNKNNTNSRTQ